MTQVSGSVARDVSFHQVLPAAAPSQPLALELALLFLPSALFLPSLRQGSAGRAPSSLLSPPPPSLCRGSQLSCPPRSLLSCPQDCHLVDFWSLSPFSAHFRVSPLHLVSCPLCLPDPNQGLWLTTFPGWSRPPSAPLARTPGAGWLGWEPGLGAVTGREGEPKQT